MFPLCICSSTETKQKILILSQEEQESRSETHGEIFRPAYKEHTFTEGKTTTRLSHCFKQNGMWNIYNWRKSTVHLLCYLMTVPSLTTREEQSKVPPQQKLQQFLDSHCVYFLKTPQEVCEYMCMSLPPPAPHPPTPRPLLQGLCLENSDRLKG